EAVREQEDRMTPRKDRRVEGGEAALAPAVSHSVEGVAARSKACATRPGTAYVSALARPREVVCAGRRPSVAFGRAQLPSPRHASCIRQYLQDPENSALLLILFPTRRQGHVRMFLKEACMTRFSCPSCGKSLNVSKDSAGAQIKCPGCGEQVTPTATPS